MIVFKKNITQWIIFILFVLVLLIKSIVFNWICFPDLHGNLISLLMSIPQKLVPAMFVAAFVFATKRQWWTIIVNILVDIWIIANLFYIKANGILLSYEAMTMVNNMDGFWDSLYGYIGWDLVVFPIITLIYTIIVVRIDTENKRNFRMTMAFIIISLLLNIGDQVFHKMYHVKIVQKETGLKQPLRLQYCLPFSHAISYAQEDWIDYNWWAKQYVYKFSIISYFPSCFIYHWTAPSTEVLKWEGGADEQQIELFLSTTQSAVSPQANIVFILVESFESWALDEVCGVQFMPNLNRIIQDKHTLFCPNMKSQTIHGNSADGQLIDVTGLLPISDGVVCNSFPTNTYPSIAQCYPNSSIINPCPGAWKQTQMTKAYHFRNLIEPVRKSSWIDRDVSNELIQYVDTTSQPFCTLGITVSSHMPFTYGIVHPIYTIDGMPAKLNAYLNSLAYADSCIGAVYEHIRQSDILAENTILVISGDHTVFRFPDKELDNYARSMDIHFQTSQTCIPLIINAPTYIHTQVDDSCYQMDIYPTVMYAIGCQNYFWKGLGVNLWDKEMRNHRIISEEDAYKLSNQIIKSNYFSPK